MNPCLFCNMDTMNTSKFTDAIRIEKSLQPIADKFYKNTLGATRIKRYSWDIPDQKIFQQNDVDCSIELYAPGIEVFWLNVSEKFRRVETGDMCIELWSDFKNKKPGWATKELDKIKPDMYLYSTPSYFFEVWRNTSFSQMINSITSEWTWDKINNTFDDGSYDAHKKITVGGHSATLLKTWTDNKYYGICICIPWKTLYNEYFIDINMYDHNGLRWNIDKIYEY